MFIGFSNGVNGYKLWKMELGGGSKFIINRDVFYETNLRMKCKDMGFTNLKAGVKKTQFDVESSTSETRERMRLIHQVQVEDNQQWLLTINWLKIGRGGILLHL